MDYYRILGVSSDATLSQIKEAYRSRAKTCHPDMGGSHEAMSQLNEAWSILSNQIYRMHYDKARNNANDKHAQSAAAENSRTVHDKSREYPRDWHAFESWLNAIINDFTRAEYGHAKITGGIPIATSKKSFTGIVFVGVGLICGAIVGLYLAINILGIPDRHIGTRLFGLVFASIGSFVGAALHEGLGKKIGA
jgi:hypothetical protein